MTNGSKAQCDRIEARLDAFNAEIARRGEQRDAEFGEIREVIADLTARVVAAERSAEKAPSWLSLLATGAAIAGLVGGLGRFTLLQTTEPMKEAIVEMKAESIVIRDRQDNTRQRVSRMEGRIDEVDERVGDMDNQGTRRRGQ